MTQRSFGFRPPESERAPRSRSRTGRRSKPADGRVQSAERWSLCVGEVLGPVALRCSQTLDPVLVRRTDKGLEQGVRLERFGFEFRMELAPEIPGMIRKLTDLDVNSIRRLAGDTEAAFDQALFMLAIEFVAMPMPFADLRHAIGLARAAALSQHARIGAQTHGAAEFIHALQLAQLVNHAVGRGWIELSGIGVLHSAYVSCKLDHHGLHAETNAEIRNPVFASIPDRRNHSFNAAL